MNHQLIVIAPEGGQTQVELSRERLLIGRHIDNDLVLHDAAVSSRHAAILNLARDLVVEDLGSTNGTYVNGRLVAKQLLSSGDEIGIGRYVLRLVSANEDPTPVPAPTPPPVRAPLPSTAPPVGVLRVSSGPQAGREIALDKPLATIGKPGVQVAAITRRVDGYFVVDAGRATQGRPALLNGVALGHQARRLSDGDVLEVAGASMRFHLLSPRTTG